ncbi:uncharacterized protein LOC109853356 isoform X2 [Pseudomyrmex gracilis]|uniref:uncharacterized protein LOC109853356 isoform X2 n=1 Tax=Pseudomyrmex gracilis TaxID=219809 RepID=UPI000994A136|nr:uncharacterized protein LOC109853356 isoform X2 [Pseudomyrmex gracilis]
MASTTNFSYLLLLITLTLSINAEPDGTSSVPPIPGRESSLQPSSIEHSFNATDDKKLYTSVMAEGGPIIVSTSQQPNIEDAAKFVSNKFDESKPRENVPKERNANPSVVPRKGVEEKIKARKGVDPEPERTNVLLNQTTKEDTKPIIETSPIQETLAKEGFKEKVAKYDNNSSSKFKQKLNRKVTLCFESALSMIIIDHFCMQKLVRYHAKCDMYTFYQRYTQVSYTTVFLCKFWSYIVCITKRCILYMWWIIRESSSSSK